jgi:hypothetical protein
MMKRGSSLFARQRRFTGEFSAPIGRHDES